MKSESKSKACPKLIVLGTDGNAGKTTISRLVLERNLDSLPAIEAEAVADANASGTKNRLTVRDARTGKPMLVAALLAEIADKAIIVDVGTNLYHAAIDTLSEHREKLAAVPVAVIVPLQVSREDQRKLLAHISKVASDLDALDMPHLKRILVLNRVAGDDSDAKKIAAILDTAKKINFQVCKTILPEVGVVDHLKESHDYDLEKIATQDSSAIQSEPGVAMARGDLEAALKGGSELARIGEAARLLPIVKALAEEISSLAA